MTRRNLIEAIWLLIAVALVAVGPIWLMYAAT